MSAEQQAKPWRPFSWYTGPEGDRTEGVHYGRHDWPSRSELVFLGRWEIEGVTQSASPK